VVNSVEPIGLTKSPAATVSVIVAVKVPKGAFNPFTSYSPIISP
jgi:hypothetical protein